MSRLLKLGKASAYLGVSIQTLRRWEKEGKFAQKTLVTKVKPDIILKQNYSNTQKPIMK